MPTATLRPAKDPACSFAHHASGFTSYNTTRVIDLSAPAAPTDLRLRQGDLSGSAIARYQAARSQSMNHAPSRIGDPNVEANWKDAGMFSGGKATISGIAPGKTERLNYEL